MFKLQIVSDLRLHYYKNPIKNCFEIIKPSAPYLAILGDVIEMYNIKLHYAFLQKVCKEFQKVIYILGNHEYYQSKKHLDMDFILQKFKTWAKDTIPNLIILENESIELDGIKILGTTLWTHIPSSEYVQVSKNMCDYQCIYVKDSYDDTINLITPEQVSLLHKKAVLWLNDEIKKEPEKPIVVLTHHAPLMSGTSDIKHVDEEIKHAYATDLTGLFKENVKVWGFGHTHYKCNFKYKNTQVVSNPMGYIQHEDTTKYENNFIIEI